MSTDCKMTINERRKYLRVMKKRYRQGSKKWRGQLLDEMEAVTELHRKSLVRLMKGPLTRKHRRKQRGRTYGPQVDDALRVIAESLDYVCSEHLPPGGHPVHRRPDGGEHVTISDSFLHQLGLVISQTSGTWCYSSPVARPRPINSQPWIMSPICAMPSQIRTNERPTWSSRNHPGKPWRTEATNACRSATVP